MTISSSFKFCRNIFHSCWLNSYIIISNSICLTFLEHISSQSASVLTGFTVTTFLRLFPIFKSTQNSKLGFQDLRFSKLNAWSTGLLTALVACEAISCKTVKRPTSNYKRATIAQVSFNQLSSDLRLLLFQSSFISKSLKFGIKRLNMMLLDWPSKQLLNCFSL